MTNIFTRLYWQFISTLVLVILVALTAGYVYSYQRLNRFAETRVEPVVQIAAELWQGLKPDEQDGWLAVVSSLTGASWNRVALDQETGIQLVSVTDAEVEAVFQLDAETLISVDIHDWSHWLTGLGWLTLDSLSKTDANLREARLQTIKAKLPWPVDRVNRDAEGLSTLERHQLSRGQSIRVFNNIQTEQAYYFPAGASQAIKIGPVPDYFFLNTLEWCIVVLASLIILSGGFVFWLLPLQKRFDALFQSVGSIGTEMDSVNLPTAYEDNLGQLSRQVESMAHRLIQQVHMNKELNQAVSHDLKTPLARMRFALELLQPRESNPYIMQLHQDVELLTKLTQELLLYHQLMGSQPVNKQCAARLAIEYLIRAVPETVRVITDLPATEILIPMMDTHWHRLVDNLVKNALQYGDGVIGISLQVNQNNLWLTIEDNGQGLSETEFEKLKQPFQRKNVDRNLEQQNHGLGLALVDATIKHYHGTFRCNQSDLGGARFEISIPMSITQSVEPHNAEKHAFPF